MPLAKNKKRHDLHVYAEDVYWVKKISITQIKENLLHDSNAIVLEVNIQNANYVLISHHENAWQITI
jgi:hypothetical protein